VAGTDVRSGRAPTGARGRALPPVLRRSAHHGLVLLAAALSVLLAGTVLAGLASIAGSAVAAGVDSELTANPAASIGVSAVFAPGGTAAGDRAVRSALDRALGPVPAHTYLALFGATPMELAAGPGRSPATGSASQVLVHLAATEGAAAHARLIAGAWPTGAGDATDQTFDSLPPTAPGSGGGANPVVDVAAPQALAKRLNLRVGTLLPLTSVYQRGATVRVTGIYRATATEPGFWPSLSGDPNDPNHVADSMLIAAPAELTGTAAFNAQIIADWQAIPVLSKVTTGQLSSLGARVASLNGSDTDLSVYRGRPPSLADTSINTQLPSIIAALGPSTVVARSALYLPTALLATLALIQLTLTARQLAEHRRSELVLQQIRGAGTARLLASAAGEWLLLVLPAAVCSPFLGGPLLRGLGRLGVGVGPLPAGTVGAAAWSAVGLTVVVHGTAALAPVVRAVSGRDAVARTRLRNARSAAAQRIGADLALLLVAVIGYLQVRHYHAVQVGLSVDPVLVLVPTVSTLAAAVLLLRLMPLASRALDAFGRRSRGLVLPLAGWQLSRRSARNAGPVVMMCLAVAVGSLATTAVACLDSLARDQAGFSVGADVAVQPVTGGYDQTLLNSAYRSLPGVTGVNPMTLTSVTVNANDVAEIVGIDTTPVGSGAPAPPLPTAPPDLTGPDYRARLAALDTPLPGYGLPLPELTAAGAGPARLSVTETLSAPTPTGAAPTLAVTLEDGQGLTETVSAVLPVPDGAEHTVTLPVATAGGRLTGPVRVSGISLATAPSQNPVPTFRLTLAIDSLTADGTAITRLPAGLTWRDRTMDATVASYGACKNPSVALYQGQPGVCALSTPGAGGPLLRAVVSTGGSGTSTGGGQVDLSAEPDDTAAAVPALADDLFMQSGHYRVGDLVNADLGDGHGLSIRIVGVVPAVGGVDHVQPHLLVDQRVLAANAAQTGEAQQPVSQWLLASRDPAGTAAAIGRDPRLGQARTTAQLDRQLRADPVRAGLRTVLALCRLLAPAFAVIGFTVYAVISTRESRREFALLRALGIRSRGLATLLWAEELGVALFAVVPGALIGAALAVAILPDVVVDDSGGPPFPPLRTVVPWGSVAFGALVTAGLIWLVVVCLSRVLARVDLVRTLRAGEDG